MNNETGGPAFPGQYDHGDQIESWTGMTLRDYFATKAMPGELAREMRPLADYNFLNTAKRAYAMADAMLEARK